MNHQRTLFYLAFFYSVFLNLNYAKQIEIAKTVDNFDLKIIYPQILIITDRKFRSIFTNESEVSTYIVSYWKTVNKVFSKLTNPQVILQISGIVQLDDLANHNIFTTKDRKNLLEYLNPHNLEFDVAVLMSGWNTSLSGPLGYSIESSACNFPNNFAVVNDDGQYRTIFSAAHELAHTFSAQHDDSSSECYADEKNIMSVFFYESDLKEFSICSQQKMQQFFNSKNALCLLNKSFSEENHLKK
ncbi:zinc metalloproteinase-disintegrin-like MTP9 [Leptopilina boulardi]|uniref:zinc metalloproteinase-disintegrin-like MTP9 n=1 Tax=Leptopilina boulardi TaxID=63433 RepID=UPI0021F67A90|nr:zinc metalloproteinase-disintegrin-like MTP9 [Leptopilina boulardi]